MPTTHLSGPGTSFSPDGSDGSSRPRTEPGPRPLPSVLFEPGAAPRLLVEQPECFGDLNLDQVLSAMIAGHEEYDLEPFFHTALHDVGPVQYRQEALQDLERVPVRESVERFAERMRAMRAHLTQRGKLHYALEQQAWFVDAVEIYCGAVAGLERELAAHELGSRALRGLRDYLVAYVASERFTRLSAETETVKEAVAAIRYAVRIDGPRVTVSSYENQPDYSAEVLKTFDRFRQGAVRSYLVSLRDEAGMNHIEAQILELVARLYPQPFDRRTDYCARHGDYLDPVVARFDREVQFYLGYLDLIDPLRAAGLPFSFPRISARSKDVAAVQTFDIALANKLVPEGREVVCNDFSLQGPERIFVVSGPNNGGKTTFARTFGQLHHLASLGLPVPGSEARLLLPDQIHTHFERQEAIETLRGKFDEELVRVHAILERATSRSVIVMNESFNSTTLGDALFVGTAVMQKILELGALGVYVTFVDEIASLSEATVSMVTQIVPENPAERTFKLERRPADGLAYAWAIAEKYGLTYERLTDRIGS